MSPEPTFLVVPLGEVPLSDPTDQHDPPVVLVVDDERVIADTLSTILSKNGFAPLTAYDAKSALELAATIPPDLLISDVAMPGMNGIELAIAIADSVPDCKILLFSGQASTVDLLDRARHAGHHFNLLTKPIHPTDMLKRIRECLKTPPAVFTPPPAPEFISL
jgi:DNA-binding response OmpR family regulator